VPPGHPWVPPPGIGVGPDPLSLRPVEETQAPAWEPAFEAEAEPQPESPVLAFSDGRLAVASAEPVALPTFAMIEAGAARVWAIGRLDGETAFAAELSEGSALETKSVRAVLAEASPPIATAACRAVQIVEWELAHAFCGRCGGATTAHDTELALVCESCGTHLYPRITPAVIVRVDNGERILLARRAGLARPFFSVLAGFVEAGETLEETVRREVREEVGIEVEDVRYFGSQPWPFPSQLMIGFTARYGGGELAVDETELAEAAWFAPDELPPIPGPFTIARWLIDDFVGSRSA
jgi:NAD+ diphosphatase